MRLSRGSPGRARSGRRAVATVLIGSMGFLAVAGCSSNPLVTEGTGVWPLTGLEGYPGDEAPTIAVVKIDDSAAGRPQVGIGQADLVVQELVEGGTTRIAAMFQSDIPDELVGPVRSFRSSDIGIVAPTEGVLVASGGAPSPAEDLQEAGIEVRGESTPGFERVDTRVSPYNLAVDVGQVQADVEQRQPDGPILPFEALPAELVGKPADSLTVSYPAVTNTWAYDADGGSWRRTDVDGDDYAFTSVLVLSVDVVDAGYTDVTGAPVPISVTEGEGEGLLVTGAASYPVTWRKGAAEDPWELMGADGSPVPVPPGRTWMSLIPAERGSVRAN